MNCINCLYRFKNLCIGGMLLFFFLQVNTLQAQHQTKLFHVDHLICEYKTDPICIDQFKPRLGWKLKSNDRNIKQTAYQVRVFMNKEESENPSKVVWESGKVTSDQSVHIVYNGAPLITSQQYYWQVKVWNNKNQVSPWSEISSWRMGLLSPADWSAKWIESDFPNDTTGSPAQQFRKTFKLEQGVKEAHLYITAHGVYEAQLNGERIGNDYFTPGWTSYNNHLQYQVYDVTKVLKTGLNAAGVTLGDGWYRGYTYDHKKDIYGQKLALLFQLEVIYKNGKKEILNSDGTWKTALGPIRSSSFFDGEVYDARKETKDWAKAGYNDQDWSSVKTNEEVKGPLVAMDGPPVKKQEKFVPLKVFKTPEGDRVIDFGQNLVGWVKFKLKGNSGDTLRIFHAEVLDQQGNFYTKNLRSAKQEITYVFKGGATEIFEPHFTFQGFRYVKIQGYSGPLDSTNIEADALYSDMAQTGTFATSNPLINQLQHNILWGQKGNFVDVPTDCPQRDERMGWTGDAQAFCRTATFNMDMAGFYTKWLKDLSADQHPDGAVPYVIPDVLRGNSAAATGWADVATILPWNMYLAYGDKQILSAQYKSMKAWVDYMQAHTRKELWDTGTHFGDWLSYDGKDYDGGPAITDKNLIAQTFFAHSTQLLINTARILGKEEDVEKYSALLETIKKAFQKEYVTPAGKLTSGTQTAYVLALNFDMLPENLRTVAAQRLVDNIHDYDGHLTTGFLGTPYICHVLTRFGHIDVAYQLLNNDTYPSWLYPVKNGATTIWERWNGIKPDKSFEDPGMNSFNHYAYGAIGDWMYRVITGISTDDASPGFHQVNIAPQPGGKLTEARGQLETLYGSVGSSWTIKGDLFTLDVMIPPNTTAKIVLPDVAGEIKESGRVLSTNKDFGAVEVVGNTAKLLAGSGNYHFEYKRQQNLNPPK